MKFERLNLQEIDQQDTPEGSHRDEYRSHMSHYGAQSDAHHKGSRANNQSFLHKSYNKQNSLEFHSNFGDMKGGDDEGRKILYRVSKKIYTPKEIEEFRGRIIKNSKRSTKKFLHYFTSI